MLDEGRLRALLAQAGAALEVPPSAAADIVERAAEHGGPGRTRRMVDAAARHRVLAVAAGLLALLVLVATLGALVRGAAPPTRHAAPAATPSEQGVHAPSHTGTAAASPQATSQRAGSAAAGAHDFASAGQGNGTSQLNGVVGQSARIEQTGSLGLAVGRGALRATMTKLEALAGASGGFVASSQTRSGSGTGVVPSGTITLQVPVHSFATVLKQAESMGQASDVTTRATDVTGKYVNLQARVAALQASRQQYLTILSKATTVGEVLSVQEQVDAVESQIEQLQGQLQVLTNETSYSTLTVRVNQSSPAHPGPLPASGLVQAWHDSVGGFVAGAEGVVRLAGPTLFALLCLGVVLIAGRALWRRAQRSRL